MTGTKELAHPGSDVWNLAADLQGYSKNDIAMLNMVSHGGPWSTSATLTEERGVVLLSVTGELAREVGKTTSREVSLECRAEDVRKLCAALTVLADGLERLTALKAQES